jgi:hypothetical protein
MWQQEHSHRIRNLENFVSRDCCLRNLRYLTRRESGKGTSKRGRKKRESARNRSIWSFAYPRYHKLGIALSFCAVILCLIINLRCVSVAARNFAIVPFQNNTSSSSSSHLPPQQQPTPSRPKYVHPDLPAIPDL